MQQCSSAVCSKAGEGFGFFLGPRAPDVSCPGGGPGLTLSRQEREAFRISNHSGLTVLQDFHIPLCKWVSHAAKRPAFGVHACCPVVANRIMMPEPPNAVAGPQSKIPCSRS